MFLVDEKMGAAAVDEEDELLLVFCRLVGGAVGEPPVLFEEDIFQNEARAKFCQKWPQSNDGKPRNGNVHVYHLTKKCSTFKKNSLLWRPFKSINYPFPRVHPAPS